MIDSFQTHLLVEAVWHFYYCFFILPGQVTLYLPASNTCKAWRWVLRPLGAGGCATMSMGCRVCPPRAGYTTYTGWGGWLSYYFTPFPSSFGNEWRFELGFLTVLLEWKWEGSLWGWHFLVPSFPSSGLVLVWAVSRLQGLQKSVTNSQGQTLTRPSNGTF